MPADRELIAQREIGHTDIAPWLSRTLTAVFLATIAVVPAIQTAYDLGQWRRGERAGALPQSVDALRLPAVGLRTSISAEGSPLARIFAADREVLRAIHSFEDTLEERSRVGAFIRPRVQRVLTEQLGAGNEQVYCGRSGWLFFRPAVDHLMGPGFIDERELAWAASRGDELGEPRHSDPMPAILEFRNQLANRGIELLLVPVPVKAAVYPELLSERYAGGGEPLSNPSFANFLAELADRQVRVLDPTPLIAEAKESDGELQYLRTDTHWTPRAVDLVADRLAITVRGLVDLEQMDAVRYTSEAEKSATPATSPRCSSCRRCSPRRKSESTSSATPTARRGGGGAQPGSCSSETASPTSTRRRVSGGAPARDSLSASATTCNDPSTLWSATTTARSPPGCCSAARWLKSMTGWPACGSLSGSSRPAS